MNLQRSYEKEATDLITVFTSVEMNGKKKVICDYGNSGPTKLWAIEQLIEDLMDDAEWKPVRTSEIPKK